MDKARAVRGGLHIVRYGLAAGGTFAFVAATPSALYGCMVFIGVARYGDVGGPLNFILVPVMSVLFAAVATGVAFPVCLGTEVLFARRRLGAATIVVSAMLVFLLAGAAFGSLLLIGVYAPALEGSLGVALQSTLGLSMFGLLFLGPLLVFWILLRTPRLVLACFAAWLPKLSPYIVAPVVVRPGPEGSGVRAFALPGEKREALLVRARLLLVFFALALIASGLTAIPLKWETGLLARWAGVAEGAPADSYHGLAWWLATVREGIVETAARHPFMAYGTDWLAFAHVVLGILFLGAIRDPARNVWVLTFGLIACALVIPWALVFGAVRGIPFGWRLVDCSFGVFGFIPLWLCRRYAVELTV